MPIYVSLPISLLENGSHAEIHPNILQDQIKGEYATPNLAHVVGVGFYCTVSGR